MRHGLLALAAVIGATCVLGVAPAMASVHFSDTEHGIKVSGSITAYKGGTSPKTCTPVSSQSGTIFAPDSAFIESGGSGELAFTCPGSLTMSFLMGAANTTTVELLLGSNPSSFSPWGGKYQQGVWLGGEGIAVADWKNGAGATSSTITFSNDPIGYAYEAGYPTITLSGSLKATTASGGLLTLLP